MKKTTFTSFALACISHVSLSLAASCNPVDNVHVTFYGWPDNSPPGPANAFDCGRGKDSNGEPIAGGTGTYDDPISFATATDNNNFPQCGVIYVPALHKYFRNEDDCAQCKNDWDNSKQYHVDLWTGSNTQGGGDGQVSCETNLPVNGPQTIINDPPPGLPVDTGLLYDVSSGACSTTSYGVGDASSLCAGGSDGSSGGGKASPPPSTLATKISSSLAVAPTPSPPSPAPAPTSSSAGQTSCTWQGHCLGAPCQTYNDCDGTNVCGPNNVCVPLS